MVLHHHPQFLSDGTNPAALLRVIGHTPRSLGGCPNSPTTFRFPYGVSISAVVLVQVSQDCLHLLPLGLAPYYQKTPLLELVSQLVVLGDRLLALYRLVLDPFLAVRVHLLILLAPQPWSTILHLRVHCT